MRASEGKNSVVLFRLSIAEASTESPSLTKEASCEELLKNAGFTIEYGSTEYGRPLQSDSTNDGQASNHTDRCIVVDLSRTPNVRALTITWDELKALASERPLVAFVNSNDEPHGVKAVQVGASDYALKDQDSPSVVARLVFFAVQQKQLSKEIDKTRAISLELSSLKQRFINRVGKEFLSPLNGILGSVNSLLEEGIPGKFHDSLTMVREAAKSLCNLVDDVLALTEDGVAASGYLSEQFDLGDELKRIMSLLRIECQSRNIALVYEFAEWPNHQVVGDLVSLKQLFILLVTRLSKVLPRTSIVRVAVQCSPIDKVTRAIFAHFAIAFTNMGRLDPKILSDKLPLSLANELTQQLKGRVWKDFSNPAGGVIHFVVPLYVAENKALSGPSVEDGTSPLPQKSLKVLVVDDNQINRVVLQKWLERRGHDVKLAVNGVEAITLAESLKFDLILMDIQMPELDGIEATKLIRANSLNSMTPIFAVSAHVQDEDIPVCLEAGMNWVLQKPINFEELSGLLTSINTSNIPNQLVRIGKAIEDKKS